MTDKTDEFMNMVTEGIKGLLSQSRRDAVKGAAQSAPLLVDKQTLARLLTCSAGHIDNLRKKGLPFVPVGDAVRFDPAEVLAWLKKQGSVESSH
jgi:hypothetical protein